MPDRHIGDFLTDDGWHPTAIADGVIEVAFAGASGTWSCFAVTPAGSTVVVFYSVFPGRVPLPARPDVVQLLTRINFGLASGNFEMDLDDGETRFRTSIDTEGAPITDAVLRNLVYGNVATMDEHLTAIRKVADGTQTPTAAYADLRR